MRSDGTSATCATSIEGALLVATRHPLARRRAEVTAGHLATMPHALLSPDFVVRRLADAYFRAHQLIPRVTPQSNSNAFSEGLLALISREGRGEA
nr:LysR substrate-binding domain-containing protein [Paraburkholderia silvatlantica]